MNTNDKTLADVQPGGRVRLGDQAERARFEAWAISRGWSIQRWAEGAQRYCNCDTEKMWEAFQAALSAQPSPGGQGDSRSEKAETFLRQYLTYLRSSPRQGLRPRWCDVYEALEVAIEALAARQPVGEPAGYATFRDGRFGSWLFQTRAMAESHDSTAVAGGPANSEIVPLFRLPAQAVDLGAVREMLESWKNSDYPFSYEGQCAQRALNSCIADLKGWLDSQAVGNGN